MAHADAKVSPFAPKALPQVPVIEGVRFAACEAGIRYANRKDLRMVPLTDTWARREMRLCRRPGGNLPQFADTLIRYLTEAAQAPV